VTFNQDVPSVNLSRAFPNPLGLLKWNVPEVFRLPLSPPPPPHPNQRGPVLRRTLFAQGFDFSAFVVHSEAFSCPSPFSPRLSGPGTLCFLPLFFRVEPFSFFIFLRGKSPTCFLRRCPGASDRTGPLHFSLSWFLLLDAGRALGEFRTNNGLGFFFPVANPRPRAISGFPGFFHVPARIAFSLF